MFVVDGKYAKATSVFGFGRVLGFGRSLLLFSVGEEVLHGAPERSGALGLGGAASTRAGNESHGMPERSGAR